jgi:hypothetical protein
VYAQIEIGCQTQSQIVTCDGCIAFRVCKLRLEIGDKFILTQQDGKDILRFLPAVQPLLAN